ncbi:recombinase family protein [Enterocloster clostridioformis]|uniref:recombinase family protein n=1 Tax=Enterocloster clostridioformis TaxID=1531 RepID=UPI0026747DC0|nr:recombinase family protein [Enterocloster clostridioformis]
MVMMNTAEYSAFGAALAGGFRAAIYCRLSKDDDLQGESASIANQRDMLEKYCEKQGWEVAAVFQDDGYTGLNMERPDLKRMLKAIERRQINLVVTKDLSRLGRNYLQTGQLIEDFFPRNGVRYIAMNDGIDTMRENNDIAPFKNILNEMYSKDISKKVHSSYLLKAQKGQFTGCIAPFGYRKDPEDKNHLLVDDETAPIVRLIFGYALDGHGPNYIRRRLEEAKFPCPTWWNRQRGYRNVYTKWEKKDPENGKYIWDFSVIKDILMNPVYTGAIASQKKEYRFKIGTIGEKKPEDWIVVEGTHEALVDKKSFAIVQGKLKSRQRPGQSGEPSMFAGLLKCGECGKSLTVRYTNAKHPQQIYSCKTYNAFGKHHCSQHRIDYDILYSLVLNKIRECAAAALMDGEAVADRLTDTCQNEQQDQREALERSLTKDGERTQVLEKMVLRLYEDMVAGRITEANFNLLLEKTQNEQAQLRAKVEDGRKRLADEIRLAVDARQWVESIQEYQDITELDASTLNRLIKEIVVHETIDSDKTRHISIEIHFNLKPIPEVEQVTA